MSKKKAMKMMFGSLVLFTFFMVGNYALAIFYSGDFTASTINEGFPIPLGVVLIKEKIELEEYRWGTASEDKHLPFSYERVIKQWGWKKTGDQGVTSFYEKQGERVTVTILDNYLMVQGVPEKEG